MKNKLGFTQIICLKDFSVDFTYKHNNAFIRTVHFTKDKIYSFNYITEYFNRVRKDKFSIYDEKGFICLATLSMELLPKYFCDLEKSIDEVNSVFEEMMDKKLVYE